MSERLKKEVVGTKRWRDKKRTEEKKEGEKGLGGKKISRGQGQNKDREEKGWTYNKVQIELQNRMKNWKWQKRKNENRQERRGKKIRRRITKQEEVKMKNTVRPSRKISREVFNKLRNWKGREWSGI